MNNQDCLTSACTALEALDAEALASHYHPDAVFEDMADGGRLSNPPALLNMYRLLFSQPGMHFEVTSSFLAGNKAAIEWTWTATSPNSGEQCSVCGVSILQLHNGTVVLERIYYDSAQAPI